jgi:methylated-DNA-[protein]-cysteine S-methyltransferase
MDEEAGIYAQESDYLERTVQIGTAQGRVISVSFPQVPDEGAQEDHDLFDRIAAYLEGAKEDFDDVEVALTMATDQRDVLDTVRGVPYGEQVGVVELTRMVAGLDPEDDADHNLVRQALDTNPVPLFVPDHRVRDGPSAAPPDVEQKFRSLEGL